MRLALVTGASGFIGRHLGRRLLSEGRSVRVLCRATSLERLDPELHGGAEIVEGDLRDGDAAPRAMRGVNQVFHCAGHVSDWGAEEQYVSVNVGGTQRLLDAACAEGVERFVHLSSIAVFGVPSPPSFDDDSPYGPGWDLYSRTKIAGEQAALAAYRDHGLPVTVLRPSVVYGPFGTWLEQPVAMIRKGKMFLLGGGKGTCHPCYIENLVDAMLLAAEHPGAPGNAYIVGDDEAISFAAYFNHLARIVGRGPIRRSIPLPLARALATGFETTARLRRACARPLLTHTAIDMVTARSRMSMRKVREELGFKPRYDVSSAMAELERWLRTGELPAVRAQGANPSGTKTRATGG
ncbi:MAG TPA: NAD-dependent epimerase/dehydratase family protein [Anaeromyxobacteraceae bacterium]|nr:NAD-dependent epimerase/dehydratase family protein [Anaeromyxobacteraceae bacterium]